MAALLDVKNLTTRLATRAGTVTAVDNVSFSLDRGETLGLVGESGSGKSMTCLSIERLLPPNASATSGEVLFKGQNLLAKSSREMASLRGREIGMILQDPMTSLNPVFTIGNQVGEIFRLHRRGAVGGIREQVLGVLRRVGIPAPEERYGSYPHQFSGGMRQRVSIAINIANEPDLLIADEPTTALDVTIQLQILQLLKAIQQESGMAIVFVTHDLNLVARFCDRVAVMYAGRIVETGPVKDVFAEPRHPYTRSLLAAIPRIGADTLRLQAIPGQPPSMTRLPTGCRFAPRCSEATVRCRAEYPRWSTVSATAQRGFACWEATGGSS
ncbi:MAG: ABC transporter ATP-binding protein [Reyranella sp.]|nr:ABC transporter ATP-binding protein [Reyranella sp.]